MLYNRYLIEHTMQELQNMDYDSEYLDTLFIILYELEYKLHMVSNNAELLKNYTRLINIIYIWYNMVIKVMSNIVEIIKPGISTFIMYHDTDQPNWAAWNYDKTINEHIKIRLSYDKNNTIFSILADFFYDTDMLDDHMDQVMIEDGVHKLFDKYIENFNKEVIDDIRANYNGTLVFNYYDDETNPFDEEMDDYNWNQWEEMQEEKKNIIDKNDSGQVILETIRLIDEPLNVLYDLDKKAFRRIVIKYIDLFFKDIFKENLKDEFESTMPVSERGVIKKANDGWKTLQTLPTAKKVSLETFYDYGLSKDKIITFDKLTTFIRSTGILNDFAEINKIINLVHFTGGMSDYFEEEHKRGIMSNNETDAGNYEDLFSELSDGEMVDEWDKDLQEMGFKLNKTGK